MQYASTTWNLTRKIFSEFDIKTIAGGITMLGGFFFGSFQRDALLSIFMLIMIDFVTGIYAAIKNRDKIESKKFGRTAIKIAVYFMMLAAGCLAGRTMQIGWIDDSLIGFLAATELLSIIENTGRAGFAIPSKVVKFLHSYIK